MCTVWDSLQLHTTVGSKTAAWVCKALLVVIIIRGRSLGVQGSDGHYQGTQPGCEPAQDQRDGARSADMTRTEQLMLA